MPSNIHIVRELHPFKTSIMFFIGPSHKKIKFSDTFAEYYYWASVRRDSLRRLILNIDNSIPVMSGNDSPLSAAHRTGMDQLIVKSKVRFLW